MLGGLILLIGLVAIYLFHTGQLKELLNNLGIKTPEFKMPNIGDFFTKSIPGLFRL